MRRAGTFAIALIASLVLGHQSASARERVHFIAADEVTWNYAPLGRDIIAGRPLRPLGPAQLGWMYHKALYREYTDSTFAKVSPIASSERYRGLVGPTIHAEVGDTVVVVFRNRTRIPVDIAPGGVVSIPIASAVRPGTTRTFRWPISAADGPDANDGSSIMFEYASDLRPDEDATGLIGPLIVTRRGSAHADGSPKDVDREIVTFFSSQLEDQNPLFDENLHDRAINGRRISRDAKSFFIDNAFPSINGYVYGNMPMPAMRTHDRVRWYVLTSVNGFDGHSPTWNGQTVLVNGNRSDTVSVVFRGAIVDMVPDNPGIWLLTCSVDIHLAKGMEARYQVLP